MRSCGRIGASVVAVVLRGCGDAGRAAVNTRDHETFTQPQTTRPPSQRRSSMTTRNNHTVRVGPALIRKLLKSLAAVLAFGAITATGAAAYRLIHDEHYRSPRSHTDTSHSLRLKLHVIANVVVHNGVATAITPSTTFATGDTAYFVADILNGNHKVGREDVTCGLTTATIELCTAVDHLPGGLVTHTGASSLTDPAITDVITGGTGRYLGTRGSVVTRFNTSATASIAYVFAH